MADDLSLRSFLEGNLTYYYTSSGAFDSVGVITSYSIHYTKLYEIIPLGTTVTELEEPDDEEPMVETGTVSAISYNFV